MVHCVVRPEQVRRGVVALDARQARHLITVLRLRPGDEVTLVTGPGGQASVAVLETAGRHGAVARLTRALPVPPAAPWTVTLAAAIPHRPGRFDQIVDQATQLGVARVVPVVTARTEAFGGSAAAAARRRRWQVLATEAAQQSGRRTIPEIAEVVAFAPCLQGAAGADLLLVSDPSAGTPSVQETLPAGEIMRVWLLIGPEGGLTPLELTQAQQAGARRLWLGPTILRCETAAVVAVTLLTAALRDRHRRTFPPPEGLPGATPTN